jgi:alpha-L-fucosidase
MLSGFKYYPEQNSWQPSIITHYEFYVSADGKNWKKVSEGEFSNIKNNPLWQTKLLRLLQLATLNFGH